MLVINLRIQTNETYGIAELGILPKKLKNLYINAEIS